MVNIQERLGGLRERRDGVYDAVRGQRPVEKELGDRLGQAGLIPERVVADRIAPARPA